MDRTSVLRPQDFPCPARVDRLPLCGKTGRYGSANSAFHPSRVGKCVVSLIHVFTRITGVKRPLKRQTSYVGLFADSQKSMNADFSCGIG